MVAPKNNRTLPQRRPKATSSPNVVLLALLFGFVGGCFICSIFLLSLKFESPSSLPFPVEVEHSSSSFDNNNNPPPNIAAATTSKAEIKKQSISSTNAILSDLRILIAIAAYDFSQMPHLEEVLDAYGDLCATGAYVDVIIHATVPYPLVLIDLLNTRLRNCASHFSLKIILVSPTVRLHLVDLHRPMFYDKLEEYDLFIYTEDDIRISPKLIASYLTETKVLQDRIGYDASLNYNIGMVRYEYNFPSNVAMDDKTRHATQNVTRVYWEHSYKTPAVPKVVDIVGKDGKSPQVLSEYVHMKNHHQGMFLATRDLLKAWKKKEGCQFDVVTDRPGGHSQPTEGTQVNRYIVVRINCCFAIQY